MDRRQLTARFNRNKEYRMIVIFSSVAIASFDLGVSAYAIARGAGYDKPKKVRKPRAKKPAKV